MKTADVSIVATFRSTADAQLAKGVLDEASVESMIRSDTAGGMYPALSPTELLVRTDDVENARRILTSGRVENHASAKRSEEP